MSGWPGRRWVTVLAASRPSRHLAASSLYVFWVIWVAASVLAPV